MPAKESFDKLREYIRQAVKECMGELNDDISQLDSKGLTYSPNGKPMKYECKTCNKKECTCEGRSLAQHYGDDWEDMKKANPNLPNDMLVAKILGKKPGEDEFEEPDPDSSHREYDVLAKIIKAKHGTNLPKNESDLVKLIAKEYINWKVSKYGYDKKKASNEFRKRAMHDEDFLGDFVTAVMHSNYGVDVKAEKDPGLKEGDDEGGADQSATISHPYSDTEDYYEKRYDTGDLKESAKNGAPKDEITYDLPPAGNKPKKLTDPKAAPKQKSPTEPTAKKQPGFTDPKSPKKPAAYTKPKSPGANPVEKAIKEPSEKGVPDKFIVKHDAGKKEDEGLKSTQNSVCPTCNKPYTEEEKKKKKDE